MQTSIKKITNDHESWKNALAFYKDEIKIFRNRLNEVAEKNNKHPVIEEIEKYQNQLDIQDARMSDLKHTIDRYIHQLATETKNHAEHVTPQTVEMFEDLKQKTDHNAALFVEFKTDFMNFIEKVF